MKFQIRTLVIVAACLSVTAIANGSPLLAGTAKEVQVLAQPREVDITPTTNGNWAGWETDIIPTTSVVGSSQPAGSPYFRSVKGSWVQPPSACVARKSSEASIWVGIGGDVNVAAQADSKWGPLQIGTDSDCVHGHPSYYAWFEYYPLPPYEWPHVKIKPGDDITASVRIGKGEDGMRRVELALRDDTTHKSMSRVDILRVRTSALSSAEWIIEAPSLNNTGTQEADLTDFGTLDFSGALASEVDDGAKIDGTISNPAWTQQRLTLSADESPAYVPGNSFAQSGLLSATGGGFAVYYGPDAPPTPTVDMTSAPTEQSADGTSYGPSTAALTWSASGSPVTSQTCTLNGEPIACAGDSIDIPSPDDSAPVYQTFVVAEEGTGGTADTATASWWFYPAGW